MGWYMKGLLEGKINASHSCVESKMDESNRSLEAMLHKLLGMKASYTDSIVPELMDAGMTATPSQSDANNYHGKDEVTMCNPWWIRRLL